MKKSLINRLSKPILNGFLLIVLVVFLGNKSAVASTNSMGVSFEVFYDALLPYGDWVDDPNYGFIWIPYVDSSFHPYRTNGYWVMSTFGNTWVSHYDWGWAPFHYGRWFFDDFYGWAWVPGYEWGPAWVEWRTAQGYYGWAPLRPRLHIHFAVGIPVHHWVFVPRRRLLSRSIYNYYAPMRNVNVIYNRTTVINNTYVYNNNRYIAGPSRGELQRVTGRKVPVYAINNASRPGRSAIQNNSVQLYRPEIRQAASNRREVQERPSRVMTASEYRDYRSNTTAGNNTPAEGRSTRSSTSTRGNQGKSTDQDVNRNRGNSPAVDRNNARSSTTRSTKQEVAEPRQRNNAPSHLNRSNREGVRQAVPAQRQVKPTPSARSQVRSTAPSSNQVRTSSPASKPQVRQSPSTQRQVRQSTPATRKNTGVRNQSPARQKQSARVNSGSSNVRNSSGTSTQRRSSATRSSSSGRRGG